jgi:hypothetical protein
MTKGHFLEMRDAAKMGVLFICEKERELSRISAPRSQRDAANRFLTEHLTGFVACMEGLNRSASHISHVGTRVRNLIADCGWRYLSDVTAKSFEFWRRKKAGELSIKTLNEYRASMFSMLAWLPTMSNAGTSGGRGRSL